MVLVVVEPAPDAQEADLYRREAIGAFAHEVRTPLTSIRMVLELARQQAGGDGLVLDDELVSMLAASVDDLQHLADDLQETSRLERGRLTLSQGPCDLGAAIEAAVALLQPNITLEGPTVDPVSGPWDPARAVRSIVGMSEAANRVGEGSGVVHLGVSGDAVGAVLTFTSGSRSGNRKPVAADLGFSFFRSREFVRAMGGSVDVDRADRYVRITVTLPHPRR